MLGPFFFLVFMIDFPEYSCSMKTILFADETTIINSATTVDEVKTKGNIASNNTLILLSHNGLSMNKEKS